MNLIKSKGTIKTELIKIKSRGNTIHDWVITDEANACDSCLICNHYKYNHANHHNLKGEYVHICLLNCPDFIDLSNQLKDGFDQACKDFSRRAML